MKKLKVPRKKISPLKSKVKPYSKKPPASVIRKAAKFRKRSSIELLVYSWLTEDGIKFKKEKVIGRCHVDIFIEPNIVLEVQGCYFHRNICCYPEETPENLEIRIKDARRFSFFRSKGFDVNTINECMIKKDPKKARALLRKIYKKANPKPKEKKEE